MLFLLILKWFFTSIQKCSWLIKFKFFKLITALKYAGGHFTPDYHTPEYV